MVFGLFSNKKRVEILREEIQESFGHVRKDVNRISEWIKHLDDKKQNHDKEISTIREELKDLKESIDELKQNIEFFGQTTNKQRQTTNINEQTSKEKQTIVQTDVQPNQLDRLTVMERAVIWSLLNAEMKLSHEDVAALLGKDKSTIRGQINAIKQKIPGLVSEIRENNGKKRIFIEENTKNSLKNRSKLKIKS